jgi:hypothetical protein
MLIQTGNHFSFSGVASSVPVDVYNVLWHTVNHNNCKGFHIRNDLLLQISLTVSVVYATMALYTLFEPV